MNEDFERTSYLQNGMFYTAEYTPSEFKPGYDRNVLIFVLGPAKNINNIVALNFHHIADVNKRCGILDVMNDFSNISKDDVNVPMIDEATCRRLFPFANDAIRVYKRKNFKNVYRVKTNRVGRYIEYNGDILMKEPSSIMNRYWLDYSDNTTAEATKTNTDTQSSEKKT